jgi:Pregnancy-associated plasma protein-A
MAKAKKKADSVRRQCGAMAVYERLCEMEATYRETLARIESETRDYVNSTKMTRSARMLYKIPIVVHCIYKSVSQKISAAQVASQIKVLNKDFRLKNSDKSKIPGPWKSLATDAGIEFSLASKDPNGGQTDGITYYQTARDSFGTGDTVKRSSDDGVDPWDTSKYLNIWVAPLSGGLLGYAQFPGGPAATDGVVITSTAFGTSGTAKAPFNLGRTTTHEIGHYLNLYHIWGDTNDCSGSDYCSDTPSQKLPNYGSPSFPHISCNNGPNGDMFMNYMDYVDDASMNMFTQSQVARMIATLQGPRKSLVPSPIPMP